MSKELRDVIRSATVGSKKQFRKKTVKIEHIEIEVRQLTLEESDNNVMEAIDMTTQKVDALKLKLKSVIASCYVPGTNERVFEDTDYDSLKSTAYGGYVDTLWLAINELQKLDVVDAKKN